MTTIWQAHWREYLMEAALLGGFMVSAAIFATLLQHPLSPLFIGPGITIGERIPMGLAMGLTAMALIYSPWGVRSGAHMNPVVTLTFWRLGKVAGADALMYVVAQVVGGIAGIVLATLILAQLPADAAVNYVATIPGSAGVGVAVLAEFLISGGLMLVVLTVSNTPRIAHFTGVAAGVLVCTYIVLEAPLSGMSMNPARSFGPALLAGTVESMWIYLLGPGAGMLAAAEMHRRRGAVVRCAKFHHPPDVPCIHCGAGMPQPAMAVREETMAV